MSRKNILVMTLLAVFAAGFLVYMVFFSKREVNVINAMPPDVMYFFDVTDTKSFQKLTENDSAFNALATTQIFGSLKSGLGLFYSVCNSNEDLQHDVQQNVFLCGGFASGHTAVDYLFLLQLDNAAKFNIKNLTPKIGIEKPLVSSHVFENEDIYELVYPKQEIKISFAKLQDVFMFSTSSVFIENAILQLKKGTPITQHPGFSEVANQMSDKTDYALYLNLEQMTDYFSMFAAKERYEDVQRLKKFASWIALKPEFEEDGIHLTGYASSNNDSTALNLQKYTGQFRSDINPVIPDATVFLWRVNASQLAENIGTSLSDGNLNRTYFDHWSSWITEQIIVGVSESLDKQFMKRSFIIIPTNDVKLAISKLKYCVVSDSLKYRGHVLMELNGGKVVAGMTGIAFPENCYAAWYDKGLMLTQDVVQMKSMIDAIENQQILSKEEDYLTFNKELSASFNVSMYLDLSGSEQILKAFISDKHIDSLSTHFPLLQKFTRMELQFTNNKDIYLVNGFIRFSSTPNRKSGLLWKQQIDLPVESGPFTVEGQTENERNIIVQDTSHQVYLISASGDVIWKLPFTEKIIGEVHEVDFYGNGGNQILFNTADAIHLIDQSGNPVEGFPITMTAIITNPLTVLMRSKNDYRMFVACDNGNIYGFYKDGKPISGWNPLRNAGIVKQSLFTIENGKEHYIAYLNDNGVQIKRDNGFQVSAIPFNGDLTAASLHTVNKYLMNNNGSRLTITPELKVDWVKGPDAFISGGFAAITDQDSIDVLYMDDIYFNAFRQDNSMIFSVQEGYASGKVVSYTFDNLDYFGIATDDGQLRIFTPNGKLMDGFPIPGTNRFIIDDLTKSGDKMLITVVGDMVMTYRVK